MDPAGRGRRPPAPGTPYHLAVMREPGSGAVRVGPDRPPRRRPHRSRRHHPPRVHHLGRTATVVVAVMTAALAAVLLAGTVAGARITPGSTRARAADPTYVALGDSYTSGPAIPRQLTPATDPAAPSTCLRSSENYPSLTARALGLALTDVSCGGATTSDLTGPQGAGIPAQLSAVRPDTAVVSVGIGGNDLGFSSIAAECASATPWGLTRVGWSCARHFATDGSDGLATDLAQVGARVASVLDAIRHRDRHARVFVVGYPSILPPSGPGCWPLLPFSATDAAFLRGVESRLNTTLADAAAAAGDTYVDTATASADHDACTGDDTRWVEPVVPSPHTYPLHPSAVGMAGMAGLLEQAIRSAGVQ